MTILSTPETTSEKLFSGSSGTWCRTNLYPQAVPGRQSIETFSSVMCPRGGNQILPRAGCQTKEVHATDDCIHLTNSFGRPQHCHQRRCIKFFQRGLLAACHIGVKQGDVISLFLGSWLGIYHPEVDGLVNHTRFPPWKS